MTNTEKMYAQIEKETLALMWACERFSDYLIGKNIFNFKEELDRKKQKDNFDRRHKTTSLTPLLPGEKVWIADLNTSGTVKRQIAPRSYEVQTLLGSFRRNRWQLWLTEDDDLIPHTVSMPLEPLDTLMQM